MLFAIVLSTKMGAVTLGAIKELRKIEENRRGSRNIGFKANMEFASTSFSQKV